MRDKLAEQVIKSYREYYGESPKRSELLLTALKVYKDKLIMLLEEYSTCLHSEFLMGIEKIIKDITEEENRLQSSEKLWWLENANPAVIDILKEYREQLVWLTKHNVVYEEKNPPIDAGDFLKKKIQQVDNILGLL